MVSEKTPTRQLVNSVGCRRVTKPYPANPTMRNLEIKTRYDDLDIARRLAWSLGADDMGVSQEADTYFRVQQGRLKLRQAEGDSHGTLIHYDRPDQVESRYSEYRLAKVGEAREIKALLAAALGTLVTVIKIRRLLLYSATRIHLDQVERLGRFVELETVLRGQSEEEAQAEHELVKQALGLDQREPVAVSYSDLLLSAKESQDA
jgi:adenylate cyclase class 2